MLFSCNGASSHGGIGRSTANRSMTSLSIEVLILETQILYRELATFRKRPAVSGFWQQLTYNPQQGLQRDISRSQCNSSIPIPHLLLTIHLPASNLTPRLLRQDHRRQRSPLRLTLVLNAPHAQQHRRITAPILRQHTPPHQLLRIARVPSRPSLVLLAAQLPLSTGGVRPSGNQEDIMYRHAGLENVESSGGASITACV